jgi:type II secretory ATPase GspE/PulE/Tfp pilus assembly ATPase PilB-like protein
MKIENVTNKSLKPSKVNIVLNINKIPKTFILEPGEVLFLDGDLKTMITQALRVQKQRGLIDFTDENFDPSFEENSLEVLETVNDSESLNLKTETLEETVEEVVDLQLVSNNISNIFDLSLEEVEKEKEEIIFEYEWDYLGYKNNKNSNFNLQKDWNSTLITAINMCSSEIYLSTQESADTIEINEKINDIIKETFFYKDGLFSLYKIVYNNSVLPNHILIYNSNKKNKFSKLEIKNFVKENKKSKI